MSVSLDKEHRWWVLAVVALIVVLMGVAYKFARPGLPSEVVMSTGGSGGAYEAFGKKYASALAEEGVTLTLKSSNGAVENLARLSDESSGVDVALVQSGIADRETMQESGLVSLGSMFYEPLWVFYRPGAFAKPVTSIAQLAGKRIAVGAQGSGTRVLVSDVLALHSITAQNATFAELAAQASVDQLRAGAVDVAFIVGAVGAPLVQTAFRDVTLRVADLELAETYSRLKPNLSVVTLSPGVIDLPTMIPAVPVRTIAATSSLIVRDDLHPAVVFLLMKAAKKLHNSGGVLSKTNEFPSIALLQDFPVAVEAERFAKEGVPFLYRYLPFKVANFASRAIVFLLPLLALLLPLTDWLPKLYGMRIKSRLFAHYKAMKRIDERVRHAQTRDELDAAEQELDTLDSAIGQMAIPNGYSNDQFSIRDDLDLVRTRVQRRREVLGAA